MENILYSIKKSIMGKLRYELGITKLEQEKESLYFLFNNCIDITKIPPTKDPDLRILQRCDTILLAIFDKLCKKYGLVYWLDFGTLLGAVRHNGFIPWDDDIDISMAREDTKKVIPLMKKEIEKYGLTIRDSYIHPLRGVVLAYKEKETGIWLDIFPGDIYKTSENIEGVSQKMDTYRKYFWENLSKGLKEMEIVKNTIFSNEKQWTNTYVISALETWKGNKEKIIHKYEDIFPVKKTKFEDFEFNIPINSSSILKDCYNGDYMGFPHFAINHHGQSNYISIAKRAKANNINMENVYSFLKNIYKEISEEVK